MNVLLVTSPHLNHSAFLTGADDSTSPRSKRYAQSFAPMGLVSLAVAVESEVTVQIADINKAINRNNLPMSPSFYDEAANWLLVYNADLIGFMTEVDSYHHLLRICQSIKSRNPRTLTLLGGVHASAVHSETLRHFPAIDFIVRGEGEIAFHSLLTTLKSNGKLSEVPNLSYRNSERIVATPSLPLIDDLDTLPFPDFSYLDLAPEDIIYLEVGRGCPFKCNFCFTASYWQRKHRIKSAARIMRELSYFKTKYGRTDFNFTHDLLTTDRRWVLEFCKQLAAADLNVTWTCSSRTDTIDEKQLYWMKLAGCREIYFGVETGTAEMQLKIDKNLDLGEAEKIIGKTLEMGIGATVGFIAGLPGESAASLNGTLQRAFHFLGLSGTTVHLFGFYANCGSPNFEKIKSRLLFDEHFVDFPLSDEVHADNCKLIESHFRIFSRYARLDSYDGLDATTIRAADEFFPMVNPLRHFMLMIYKRKIEPLHILVEWAHWIESHNRQVRGSPARLYQGTLNEFLDFLESFLRTNGLLDKSIVEMVRWERHKNVFRSQSNPQPVVKLPQRHGEFKLYTNPSAVIDHFEHTAEFLPEGENLKAGFFAFYARRDGTPAIVRLEDIALLILKLAKEGIDISELLDYLKSLPTAPDVSSASKRSAVAELLGQLQNLDLLIPASIPNAFAETVKATHKGIKTGYIPLVS